MGMTIPQLYKAYHNRIYTSAQWFNLKLAERSGKLPKLTHLNTRAYKWMNAHKSLENSLNPRWMFKKTEWADEIDWVGFLTEFNALVERIFIPHIFKKWEVDYDTKFDIPKDAYNPEERLKTFMQYGRNDGTWNDKTVRSINEYLHEYYRELMEPMKFAYEYQDLKDMTWDNAVEAYPPITMFRHGATSCWPDFVKQSPKTILERIDDAKRNFNLSKVVINYGRQQGGTRDPDTLEVKIKNRQVFGTEFASKAHGIDFTFESKQHGIPDCVYYQRWDKVFNDLITDYDRGIWVSGDWRGYDQSFNTKLLTMNYNAWRGYVPGHKLKQFDSLWSIMFGPKMMWNGFYVSNFRKGMSLSGNPLVPMFETAQNKALHMYSEELQSVLLDMKIQIDDITYQVEGKFDHEEFYKLHKDTGFKGNFKKVTRSDVQGYATFLNVDFGRLLGVEVDTLSKGTCNEDTLIYLSDLYNKIKGLHDREIINTSYGEIVLAEITDEGKQIEADKDISRFVGIVSSFGPYTPVLLIDCIFRWWQHTKTFQKLIVKLDKLVVKVAEFGFSPQHLLDYAKNNINRYS